MSETKPTQQGLVKAHVVEGEIVDAESYNTRVAGWVAQGFNVLTPAMSLSSLPRDHSVTINRVRLDPNPAVGHVYQNPLFCKENEVAPSKTGLELLAQCAGIVLDESVRTDSHSVEHVWSYRVKGHWIGFDGTRIDRIANKTLDLRDGQPDIKGFTQNQVVQTRRHGEAICETKAINRLYRMYGIKQKFDKRELDREFIVLKLKWNADMTNPIVAALVTQQRLGVTNFQFPLGPALPALPAGIDPSTLPLHQVPPEMRPASIPRNVDEDPAVNDEPPLEEFRPTNPVTPPTRPQVFTVAGVFKQGGKYLVSFVETRDEKFTVTEEKLLRAAYDARAAGVKVIIERNAQGDITSITEAEGGY